MRPIEPLETRRLLTAFTASSVAELIGDINAANAAGGENTITLAPGASFKLDALAGTEAFGGPVGLPVIASGNDLAIVGNGDTVQRSTGRSTESFRLLAVAPGASLSLSHLTLSHGLADFPGSPDGGAVRNDGTLNLTDVTLQNCTAEGRFGVPAFGGAIYSSGALTVVDSSIQNNAALGSNGPDGDTFNPPRAGASALGGGVYVARGTATVTNSTIYSNLARGGDGANGLKRFNAFIGTFWVPGGNGGDALGGGICAAGGTVTLRGNTITHNVAQRGVAGNNSNRAFVQPVDGTGRGGGIYIAEGASAGVDSFTQENTKSNTASTSDDDIFGTFTILD